MSANDSNLLSTGFDYVVAVTQDSINGTLEEYLYSGLPEAILCYCYDDNNNPTPCDYATLVANANNTDPFSVPDGTPSTDHRVQNLSNANFAFAIKAKLGLPPGVPPANLPPIIALKPGQSNVTYTMMFLEFVAATIEYGPRGSMTWFNQSQPNGTPWTFTGSVDLNFQDTDFENLPPEAQQRLMDIGDPNMFGAQQLYYDLNSSDLDQGFQFNNVPSNSALNTFMTSDFVNTYWAALKAQGGGEVLGYGARQLSETPPSSLAVTDLNFFTPDAVGNEGAPLTLNYLCATNNDQLPDTTHAGFGWNWIEPNEVSQYDGAAALNRNTFARWLNNALLPDGRTLYEYVAGNCYQPSVRVTYIVSSGGCDYDFSLTPGQTPSVSYPSSGSTILSYSYDSGTVSDQAGVNGDEGKATLSSTFNLTVSVQGNQMVIVQHLVVPFYANRLSSGAGGNIVDKQITDTYTFGVDANGQIVVSPPYSKTVDNSQIPSVNEVLNWFLNINDFLADVANWAQGITSQGLEDIPVSKGQDFVFPGGATFSFLDVAFSSNQDLVSHIKYVDPS